MALRDRDKRVGRRWYLFGLSKRRGSKSVKKGSINTFLLIFWLLGIILIPNYRLVADDDAVNNSCPGETIEEIDGATSPVSHTEEGRINSQYDWQFPGDTKDIYQVTFPEAGTLQIDATNRDTSMNQTYKFYIGKNNCGTWDIVDSEWGDEHHHTVDIDANTTIYIKLEIVSWRQAYNLKLTFTPDMISCADNNGLDGKYYNNQTTTVPIVLRREDPNIDFVWGTGSPDSSVNPDNFSVSWKGYILAPEDGNYIFSLAHDDGIKVTIDGNTIYNGITLTGGSDQFVDATSINLTRGCYPIEIVMFEGVTNAYARMKWRNDATITSSVIVDSQYLFHDDIPTCNGCDCSLDEDSQNSSSPGVIIPGLNGATSDISKCISGLSDEADGDPYKEDYYNFTVQKDGNITITTSSPNNHQFHLQVSVNGSVVYEDAGGNTYTSHPVPVFDVMSGDKVVLRFKETGDDLDEYQANISFQVTSLCDGCDCSLDDDTQNSTSPGATITGLDGAIGDVTKCISGLSNDSQNYPDKEDYYHFKVQTKGELKITTLSPNSHDYHLQIWKNGTSIYGDTTAQVHNIPDISLEIGDEIIVKFKETGDDFDQYQATFNFEKNITSYCQLNGLSEGFHIVDLDGGDPDNSFEIYCDMTSAYAPRDLIALPIKTSNNYNNNFVYESDTLTSPNYYSEAKDHGKPFNAIQVDLTDNMKVIAVSDDPTETGSYSTMGRYFSNINLIGTPFGIDWSDVNISNCDVSKLRKAYHGQAVKVNLLDYTKARCKIEGMRLKLLDDYKYLTYLGKEILEHSCKEMSERVPANILTSDNIKGHYWIYPKKDANNTTMSRSDADNDITKANERPIVVYCWYQTDLDWAWTFLLSLDGVVTNSKDDIINKSDTCSQLGLWFFVPNSKETFDRVRKYLLDQKSGDLGWENYTGTVDEKYKTFSGNQNITYYIGAEGNRTVWPYGPLGVYYPCKGQTDASNNCQIRYWINLTPPYNNAKGWMSGSPMHNIKTLPNYSDSMGAKGWVSILGSQDLNITDDWWIDDDGAGERLDCSGVNLYGCPDGLYYEPNGNYSPRAWLNFLHNDEGWIYHNDDNNDFYAYYDYMCMSETNYVAVKRYNLVPGFFDAVERETRYGNTKPNFSDNYLTTQIVNKPIQLDVILYEFDINGSQITIDSTKLENDFNKSIGVFLAIRLQSTNELKLIKFLGEYEDFDGYNGRIPLADFTVDGSYETAFLHFFYCQEDGKDWKECWDYQEVGDKFFVYPKNTDGNASDSYNNFAIRPDRYVIEDIPTAPITAGEEFNLTLRAVDWNGTDAKNYDRPIYVEWGSPALNVEEKTGCKKGQLELADSSTASFKDGLAQVTLKYDEVGDVNITLKESMGSEYAKIDVNDTDFNATVTDNVLGLNPQDIYREINSTSATNLQFTPNHFEINGTLIDYHISSDMNFTYLSKDMQISSILKFEIVAKNKNGDVTANYNSACDAKDISILNIYYLINNSKAQDMNSSTPNPGGLDSVIFELKDDDAYTDSSTSQPLGEKLSFTNIPASVFTTDHNGSAIFNMKFNFDRRMNMTVQPFYFEIGDINMSDTMGVNSQNFTIDHNRSTFLYARAKSSQKLYDDIVENSVKTPISIVVYSLPAGYVTLSSSFFTSTDEYDWFLNTIHDLSNDGSVTLVTTDSSKGSVTSSPNITNGQDDSVTVTAVSSDRPLEVDVNLTGTDEWLIYNPDEESEPSPFYKVRFIGGGTGWTGYGKTGYVVETNSSNRKTKRLEW